MTQILNFSVFSHQGNKTIKIENNHAVLSLSKQLHGFHFKEVYKKIPHIVLGQITNEKSKVQC